MVDMAHFAGLVAAGPAPEPGAARARRLLDRCTRPSAARAAASSSRNDAEIAKKINSAVFPGQQGGPLKHVIAAKAMAFKLAGEPEFKERQERMLGGAHIIAERLCSRTSRDAGVGVLTGGTDVHLVLVDLRDSEIDGKQAEDLLHEVGITVNRNAVPFDPRPPMVTSACGSAPRRWPPAASATTSSTRSPTSSPTRCGPTRRGRGRRPAGARRPPSPRASRSTPT